MIDFQCVNTRSMAGELAMPFRFGASGSCLLAMREESTTMRTEI